MKTKEELAKLILSPSSINLYYQCPRKWYFNYVLEVEEPVTSPLLRGKVTHELIEDFFKATKYVDGIKFFAKSLPAKWEKYRLGKDTEEEKQLYSETLEMLKTFAMKHEQKLKMMNFDKKIQDMNHAWNTCKPKFREMSIKSDKYKLRGFIDSVEEGFDDRTFLVDYKTSTIYKHMISEEYVRQLKLYALMWYDSTKKYPDYLVINYLKYGENFVMPFYPQMLKEAEIAVNFVRTNTQSTKIEDYPCSHSNLCHYSKHGEEDIPETLKQFALGTKDGKNTDA